MRTEIRKSIAKNTFSRLTQWKLLNKITKNVIKRTKGD